MEDKKNVLVLTSGGDSSGMNAYIKSLSKYCKNNNINLFASLYGFQGLVDDKVIHINYNELIGIENLGGSFIKTSRSKDFLTKEGFDKALTTLNKYNISCVVVVGGNGSTKGAYDLQNAGVNVLAIPGTIDNDLCSTDKSLGFDTACQNALDAIIKIKQTMDATDRGAIVEVMGRHCPDIAIFCALLSNADILITHETKKEDILNQINKLIQNGNKSPLIIVQENILDVFELEKYLENNTQKEFRSTILGYLQRGGEPTASDKLFAIQLAFETVELIKKNMFGYAIGMINGRIQVTKLADAIKPKNYDSELLKIYK